MSILALSFLAACVHPAPVAPLSPTADCDTTQAWLLAQPTKKGDPAPTFTGRCRHDLQFENVPRPADVVAEIENARGFMEMCVVKKDYERYAAQITVVVGKWDFGRNGTNDVSIRNSSTGEYLGVGTSNLEWMSVGSCIVETLQRVEFPSPRLATMFDAKAGVGAVGEHVPYKFTWHFNYPADFETILDKPPKPPIPQVLPGVGSESDN